MTRRTDEEDRRQQRLRRLGPENPICVGCGEPDPAVLELHHIAGRKYDDDLAIVCANCHRRLSDKQLDHASSRRRQPTKNHLATTGHYLLGLAWLFVMIGETLRKLGARLIAESGRDG
jgi:hypothetical protein